MFFSLQHYLFGASGVLHSFGLNIVKIQKFICFLFKKTAKIFLKTKEIFV